MTSCIQFGQSPPTPTAVYPVPAVEMRVINSDPHRQQEKGLVRTTIPGVGIIWIHPDLLDEVTPWITISCKKSRGKTKQANVIIASTIEPDSDVNSLTDSEEEGEVLAAGVVGPLAAATCSGQPHLRNYDDALVQQLEPSQEPVTKPVQQSKTTPEKPKEVRYNRPLNKRKAVEGSQPFRFDIINQLANIPARITLYELLKLSKSTREALREALADVEVFVTQLPIGSTIDEPHSLSVSCVPTDIVFNPEDMQVQGRHARPLYFTGYIGSTEITRIQVDPGSALSIMPRCVMEHLSIPAHRLSATDTYIFGFNANSTRPMEKIKLRFQIGDLKTEVTVCVIDADTSYNLLLGRPWIQRNHSVPSTLHQVMKYVDDQGQVRTLGAEQHPFKGVKNHFTDALLYQEAHEVVVQDKEVLELGNEADWEPASESDNGSEEWKLNLQALENLEMSDGSAQLTASEEESDCAWEFDASVLQCLETNATDNLGLAEYRPTYTDYSFKDEAAESLLLSLLQQKLMRLTQPPRLEGMWKTKEPDYCAYHRRLDHPTSSCLVLKDQLQYFVNNHTLRLCPNQRA